jgi:hypothetical protein
MISEEFNFRPGFWALNLAAVTLKIGNVLGAKKQSIREESVRHVGVSVFAPCV